MSNKYGEDEFNPNDLLDPQDDGSDNSDDEILNRFKVKTNKAQLSDGNNKALGNPKYSKPSAYSYQESLVSSINPNQKSDSRRRGTQLQSLDQGAGPVALPPMYSPLQQHNPKRKAIGYQKMSGSVPSNGREG